MLLFLVTRFCSPFSFLLCTFAVKKESRVSVMTDIRCWSSFFPFFFFSSQQRLVIERHLFDFRSFISSSESTLTKNKNVYKNSTVSSAKISTINQSKENICICMYTGINIINRRHTINDDTTKQQKKQRKKTEKHEHNAGFLDFEIEIRYTFTLPSD